MLSTLAILAIGGLVLVLAATAVVWWQQERIVYQPPAVVVGHVPRVTRVEYRAADGQPLYGFLVGADREGGGLLISFHGNADLAAWQVPWAEEVVRRTGWRVLLAEYRGYGGLRGTPTYAGVALDARAAWDYARELLGARPARVALYGHSLGSAVAVELAAHIASEPRGGPLRALLLQSPFTSARDMARFVVLPPALLLWRVVARVHYDTRSFVAALDTPVWVAHGSRDMIVPHRMGQAVFQAARVKGEFLTVRGAGHNDVVDTGGAEYWRWVERAVSTE